MGLGDNEPRVEWLLAHRTIVEALLAATIFAIAMGFTWVNHGGGGGDSIDVAAPPTQRAATGGGRVTGRIPPSQPAVPVSFTSSGGFVRPAPTSARIVDPETGQQVVVPLPPGTTVVNGVVVPAGSTGTTHPQGTTTTGAGSGSSTTVGGPVTTVPPTTQPPTTAPPTTQPPTTAPPTTVPPTTVPSTTAPPPQGQGAVGGPLGGVAGLLD